MNSPTKAALGAILGAALALTLAVSPASAAKPPRGGGETTPAASYTCATFSGLTLTQASVSYSPVSMQAGETITVRVSPAVDGQKILLTASSIYGSGWHDAPVTSGLAYTAPGTGTYSFGWSLHSNGLPRPDTLTWSFTCSTGGSSGGGGTGGSTADDDRDGVANTADACPGTTLPDSVRKPVAGSYYANSAGNFIDGANRSAGITVKDAGGCSASQIAKAVGLKGKSAAAGIPLSTLTSWANSH